MCVYGRATVCEGICVWGSLFVCVLVCVWYKLLQPRLRLIIFWIATSLLMFMCLCAGYRLHPPLPAALPPLPPATLFNL